ncbi:MAG TPA: type II toxin-antitoxin system death-on-curing family toxin [Streptosporangiaceae bacterium]|nr:type II toxin-antitoxin system death-on-curing family toxin [Streptosporangiaceae bacterium]
MTVYLDLEEVLAIHDALLQGVGEIRDVGSIQSALGRPQATAFGEDAYPTVFEKAAALMQSLACNHGWVDGNKRTAWVATMTFLDVNGHRLDPEFDVDAAEEFVVAIAEGRISGVPEIAAELVKYTG